MKRFASSVAAFTAVTAVTLIGACAPSAPARAAEVGSVIETVQLRYLKPSAAARNLNQVLGGPSTSSGTFIHPGIADLTPNDGDSTLIIAGTSSAVGEVKTLLRLLDVRPRRVQVKTRLFEVRFPRVGVPRETLISSSTFTGNNNETVSLSVRSPSEPGMNIEVTPHINGDNSISLAAALRVRRFTSDAPVRRIEISGVETTFRIPAQGEWKSSATLVLGQERYTAAQNTGKSRPGDSAETPRYRLEASVVELPEAPGTSGK